MAKLTLDFQPQFDFLLYGISCHLKNYKFIWNINNSLQTSFEREKDHVIYDKEKLKHMFPNYLHNNKEYQTYVNIIANRSASSYLIPEQKQADYFLIIHEPIQNEELELIIGGIKQLNVVNIIYEIDPEGLKSKHNLLL